MPARPRAAIGEGPKTNRTPRSRSRRFQRRRGGDRGLVRSSRSPSHEPSCQSQQRQGAAGLAGGLAYHSIHVFDRWALRCAQRVGFSTTRSPCTLPFLSRVPPPHPRALGLACVPSRQIHSLLRPGVCSFRRWSSRSLTDTLLRNNRLPRDILHPSRAASQSPRGPSNKQTTNFTKYTTNFRFLTCRTTIGLFRQAGSPLPPPPTSGRTTSPVPFNHRVTPRVHTRTAFQVADDCDQLSSRSSRSAATTTSASCQVFCCITPTRTLLPVTVQPVRQFTRDHLPAHALS